MSNKPCLETLPHHILQTPSAGHCLDTHGNFLRTQCAEMPTMFWRNSLSKSFITHVSGVTSWNCNDAIFRLRGLRYVHLHTYMYMHISSYRQSLSLLLRPGIIRFGKVGKTRSRSLPSKDFQAERQSVALTGCRKERRP